MPSLEAKNLYYITHIDNIASILENGILSHSLIEEEKIAYTPIYDSQIVSNRRSKETPEGKSLWSYANLYFQPRNPMMYRVLHEVEKDNIAVIGVRPSVAEAPGVFISTGNAASATTEILPLEQGTKEVNKMWKVIKSEWWREDDGSKRKIMAELLVPGQVPGWLIDTIYVAKRSVADELRKKLSSSSLNVEVVPEPNMFFQPNWSKRITDNITLVQGDMFFSQMQTLTVSVNTVGIMGKGLASRAKYQFPDVYVVYQDACRNKKIKPGKPYIYKREASIDSDLSDETLPVENPNSRKWFLLFPTKRDWRDSSRIEDIEDGLKWLSKHYLSEGIESLAVPALGCGLGGLEWREVGPLMCRYFSSFKIPVGIYLPLEKEISEEYTSRKHLLGDS